MNSGLLLDDPQSFCRASPRSAYADDHMPAHFHIEGRGFRAIVEIETMVVRAGDVRRAREALAWAGENVELFAG